MEDFRREFLTKNNLIAFLLLGIFALSIPLTVSLLKEQQRLRSKAAEEPPIVFKGDSVKVNSTLPITDPAYYTTTDPTVQVELRSPLGDPRP
ncbi:MAG: hypothetical protein UU73_C0003G0168 [Candidatus Daviesbacteria bacterium GW2011_GWA1_41_61]|uniref:Uncharacterized protein n=1 Tax=Candidatus Daviesbacteria bacterium GW2011_GWA2_40_9 TaxID=1618424 RepID=A0A0G0WFS6_9BACT|nr:MAG: hypothetical protein UU26_C0003G0058 [Candidatus Daviesbacteria bacterium GW2011_GWC1_40_9]KKR83135.1 MAG: hypothetical protein UU29_C0007G0005 [Candidatus Daviesbacteria bacterium GW2011_GWA2_40_9]KKR93482.1 MAG: hypothetical protein UU44_C0002G0143 [Candidatus Daviesbacteria bacterium GW2011_GWB1_41_15]KKS14969.1 MAG: hypothetical protein UU73_C0003G0168 [Candidatus Daviesbacteria bacterium GW2011_GWA1_41_61]